MATVDHAPRVEPEGAGIGWEGRGLREMMVRAESGYTRRAACPIAVLSERIADETTP